jgi:hypothetical protein
VVTLARARLVAITTASARRASRSNAKAADHPILPHILQRNMRAGQMHRCSIGSRNSTHVPHLPRLLLRRRRRTMVAVVVHRGAESTFLMALPPAAAEATIASARATSMKEAATGRRIAATVRSVRHLLLSVPRLPLPPLLRLHRLRLLPRRMRVPRAPSVSLPIPTLRRPSSPAALRAALRRPSCRST